MLSNIKQLYSSKHRVTHFIKLCYSDKPKNIQETVTQVHERKQTDLLQESRDISQTYEECAKFEKKMLKQVLKEKEKEASLQSRLSKECGTLFSTPTNKLASGKCVPINFDQITLQKGPDCPEWGTYSFDQLQPPDQQRSDNTKNPEPMEVPRIMNYDQGRDTIVKEKDGGGKQGGNDGITSGSPSSPSRPVRQDPGKVIFCFIPEEWWRVFIPKTGVTGFGTFLFTFITYLVSKEIYVLEHYYYHGLGALFMWIGAIKYAGPPMAKMLDRELDKFEKSWNEGRENQKKQLEDEIVHELFLQFQSEGQLMLLDAKKENVQLQLEEEYRKRQMIVYTEVLQRLNYHIALESVKRRIQQKNLVDYVTKEVKKSITPEMQDKLIYYSIDQILIDFEKEKK